MSKSKQEPVNDGQVIDAPYTPPALRGLCSVRECDEPIAGWCQTCDDQDTVKAYKLCREHLVSHCRAAPRSSPHAPYWLYDDERTASGYIWTPDMLTAYAEQRYRVRAGDALPMLVLRVDGWQVGGACWCMTIEQACAVLNARGATPITSDRFKRPAYFEDRLDMEGHAE